MVTHRDLMTALGARSWSHHPGPADPGMLTSGYWDLPDGGRKRPTLAFEPDPDGLYVVLTIPGQDDRAMVGSIEAIVDWLTIAHGPLDPILPVELSTAYRAGFDAGARVGRAAAAMAGSAPLGVAA